MVVLVSLLCGSILTGQTAPPERRVSGNVVTSLRDPAVRIELPKAAQYVGADRWVLYGIADCELHAFVEADGPGKVQRLYWVQFEGYLSSRPDLHHTYDSPKHASIGGLDFYVDSWVRAKDATAESGSDREHIDALVQAKGYRMPEMMYVRLVHLLDNEKRKELMIIYGHGGGERHADQHLVGGDRVADSNPERIHRSRPERGRQSPRPMAGHCGCLTRTCGATHNDRASETVNADDGYRIAFIHQRRETL